MSDSLGLLAAQSGTTYHQLARLQLMTEWWHWMLLLAVCAALASLTAWLYVRDSRELPKALGATLLALRLAALAGLLLYFLDLERRTEHEVVQNSRVALLVDTSRSMGLQDGDSSGVPAGPSRMEQIVAELADGQLIERLRADHDVLAYRFDEQPRPVQVAMLPKRTAAASSSAGATAERSQHQLLRQSRALSGVAGGLLAVALASLLAWAAMTFLGRSAEARAWPQLVMMVSLIAGGVVLAVAHLRTPGVTLAAVVGLAEADLQVTDDRPSGAEADAELEIDWHEALAPRGNETRIGDALQYLVHRERGGPVAGIVLLSDGQSNAGVEYSVAVDLARDARVPIYTVGLGSDRRPVNVRLVDVEAPPRVYPGDRFTVSGYVQSFGLEGRWVDVELLTSADGDGTAQERLVDQQRVRLGADAEVVPLRFEVMPDREGSYVYTMRVEAPPQDHDPRDNQRTARVDVVDRRNRVLLVAGGPTREYQFVRNLLFRDRDVTLDVYLQTAQPGTAQEAEQVLLEFPETAEELFEYDAIVAFDPDWQALSLRALELVDRWVAEGAGGMIVVSGSVHTPSWSRLARGADPQIDIVQALYPVVFYSRGGSTLGLSRTGSDVPWPLEFTRDGQDAEFLWLADDASESQQIWAQFEGVFGYQPIRDVKPGAHVYARFSDPGAAAGDELPAYLAGQFYGAGRVFFQASGEMWRLRVLDEAHFERYYTRLIRWVSQGRLLRDSSRGLLLVDRDRCLLGEHVAVRAMLTDAQHNPLNVDQVTAVLVRPDSTRAPLPLRRVQDAARGGTFAGQFTAVQQGEYRVELQVPDSADEVLAREVGVRLPAREMEQPQRNDALLGDVAQRSGGVYYVGMPAVVGNPTGGPPPLASVLQPRDQISYLPGTPDREFQRRLMAWLMGLVAGALCLEWLLRRLNRLA